MTDRERLVELIRDKTCGNNACIPFLDCEKCGNFPLADKDVDRLADLILADGWMRPPCKVGDVLYSIQGFNEKPEQCEPYTVTDITIYGNTITIHMHDEWLFIRNIYPDDIGKTVFLTREEAEKALRGGEQE